eukprot:NODE_2176_length_981_cov_127.541037.p5 GENE.NODE_2176_length_981_cov_127.541037~~NODE_2176_length_981_cov_127.541037.p5  ORF type:complete len:71 (+),score=5.81 NODE_2176_length_981_cov_127.541037:508-720(+)
MRGAHTLLCLLGSVIVAIVCAHLVADNANTVERDWAHSLHRCTQYGPPHPRSRFYGVFGIKKNSWISHSS